MNAKQAAVERCKVDLAVAESILREAKFNMTAGCTKAKTKMEQVCNQLKEEVTRAQLDVNREKVHLAEAEATLEAGFEQ